MPWPCASVRHVRAIHACIIMGTILEALCRSSPCQSKTVLSQDHLFWRKVPHTGATSLRQGVSTEQSQTKASKNNSSKPTNRVQLMYLGSRPACSYWLQRSWWWGSPGPRTGCPGTCVGQHPQPPPSQYPGDTGGANTLTQWNWNSFIWPIVFSVIKDVWCDTCIFYFISSNKSYTYYIYLDYYDYCVQKQTVVYENINILVVPVAWSAEPAHAKLKCGLHNCDKKIMIFK